jgi:hypothetical protein
LQITKEKWGKGFAKVVSVNDGLGLFNPEGKLQECTVSLINCQ